MKKNKLISSEIDNLFSEFLDNYLKNNRSKGEREFEELDKSIRNKFESFHKKLSVAVKKAGLHKKVAPYERLLRKVDKVGVSEMNLGERKKLFEYGLKMRDLIVSLDEKSPESLIQSFDGLPSDKWYSAGLGTIIFWPYTSKAY